VYYVTACQKCAWTLETWRKDGEGERAAYPFRCRSWRHEGDCRLWRGAQDFQRIKQAIYSRRHWCHVVLTYLQPCPEPTDRDFRNGVVWWSRLRKRLVERYGEIKYIQTWERHESGWPHIHLAISNQDIYEMSELDRESNFRDLFQVMAYSCGFGYVGTCDRLRGRKAMAGYLVKLAQELTGSGVKDQTPTNAPRHFRRIRASVRLLPPILKNEDFTGELLRYLDDGEVVVLGKSGKAGKK